MMELKELIPVNVSEKIRKHTTGNDLIQITTGSDKTSLQALQQILYRSKPLREKHLPAFKALYDRAIKNASDSILDSEFLKNNWNL